jgi:hypothetical protein
MDLISACIKGDLAQVKEQLAVCDIEQRDFYGNTALSLSVRYGHKHIVSLLLESGADANTKNYVNFIQISQNPLHIAAYHGNLDCALTLISHGAEVNLQDKYGRSPLHCSVIGGYIEITRLLLENEADTRLLDSYGKKAINRTNDIQTITLLQNSNNKRAKRKKNKGKIVRLFCSINEKHWKKTRLGGEVMGKVKEKVNELKNSLCAKTELLMKQSVENKVNEERGNIFNAIIRWTKMHSLDMEEKLKTDVERVCGYKPIAAQISEIIRNGFNQASKSVKREKTLEFRYTLKRNIQKSLHNLIFPSKQDLFRLFSHSLNESKHVLSSEIDDLIFKSLKSIYILLNQI